MDNKELINIYEADLQDLERIFCEDYSQFLCIARAILHDDYLAEDVIQTVFLSLYRRLELFHQVPARNRIYYIAKGIKNAAINEYRRGQKVHESEYTKVEYRLAGPQDAEMQTLARLDLEEILSSIPQLSDKLQTPLLLRCDGMSYRQISLTLGISEALARKRVQRAREQLRKLTTTVC